MDIRNSENPAVAPHSEAELTPPPPLDVFLDDGGGIRIDQNTPRVVCGLASEQETRKNFCVCDVASKPFERYLASYAHLEAEYLFSCVDITLLV